MRSRAAVGIAGLALTACASNDAALPTDAATTMMNRTEPSTRAAAATHPAVTEPATTPLVPTLASAPPSTQASARWCDLAADLNRLATEFRRLDATDSVGVAVGLGDILDRLDAIESVAPQELADDLPRSAEAFRLLDTALAAVDYNVAAADLSELHAREHTIAAANARIRDYNHATCGLDAGVTGHEMP